MKFAKALRVCCMLLLVMSFSFIAIIAIAQVPATPRVTPLDWRLGNHENETINVESQVAMITHLPGKSLIFIDGNFPVVCEQVGITALVKAGIDIDSLVGKTVRINGTLIKDTTYGIEMFLTKASQLVITKEPAPDTTAQVVAPTPATPRVRPIDWRLVNYVNPTVSLTLEGKVNVIQHIPGKSLITLDPGFLVACPSNGVTALARAGINLDSLLGKTVQITGTLYQHTTYGIQMDLTRPAQLVIPFKGVISASEVNSHINETGTVEGKVLNARKSDLDNTYYLEFSSKPQFFVVLDRRRVPNASALIQGIKGKTVQVTGKITVPEQSSPQILVRRAEDLKVM